ncbi:fumarylacetoacetate hydrolase [Pelagibacteraceae bacterium]|nr:fumarylacetoacetate hydrolase [Pelagibacteraceae bacterium]|tara:strand:- start:64 stop:840 length:777 start_codon:yes stop_codon:yes gene_type:complete
MKNSKIEKIANNLSKAFISNKVISSIPEKYTKNMKEAEKLRKLCESKIKQPIIGFKAGGTGIPVLKKLGEKEPFYASIFKNNVLASGKSVRINNYTLGIELEVGYLIKKNFFRSKGLINFKNIHKHISYMLPAIEVVGYRQKKKGIKFLGDLCSDFGANIKFVVGRKKKYKRINFGKLKTNIENKKIKQLVNGHSNTVYINPINSLKFVLNKLRKDKIILNKEFYVFTGSTIGVAPILGKGNYRGRIDKLGSVKVKII